MHVWRPRYVTPIVKYAHPVDVSTMWVSQRQFLICADLLYCIWRGASCRPYGLLLMSMYRRIGLRTMYDVMCTVADIIGYHVGISMHDAAHSDN